MADNKNGLELGRLTQTSNIRRENVAVNPPSKRGRHRHNEVIGTSQVGTSQTGTSRVVDPTPDATEKQLYKNAPKRITLAHEACGTHVKNPRRKGHFNYKHIRCCTFLHPMCHNSCHRAINRQGLRRSIKGQPQDCHREQVPHVIKTIRTWGQLFHTGFRPITTTQYKRLLTQFAATSGHTGSHVCVLPHMNAPSRS